MKSIEYYLTHDRMTHIQEMKSMVKDLPRDIPSIVKVVQNCLIHQHWAKQYGIEVNESNIIEVNIREVENKLKRLNQKGITNIIEPITLDNKLIGICRDFTVLMTSLCRELNIPARARCGFADYFEEGKYIDHWVCEVWDDNEERWIMVDAQLDDYQSKVLEITFNPLDIKDQHFITADQAWLMCRDNQVDPNVFGIFKWWGYDYLRCNLILDANSLVGIAMQPWDFWDGYKSLPIEEWTEDDYCEMDKLARLISTIDQYPSKLIEFVESNDKIKVPNDLSKIVNGLI